MVGVGKSAILQNLNNNEQIAKMFDIVIFVALTDEGNEEELQHAKIKLKCAKQKLQCEIAQRLKLNVEGLTDTKRIASRIFEELECKRYLLLLDGVWESFNLDDIGIYENEKDSKVVLASRYRDVCMGMCADDIVRVESLSEVDARKLFLEKLGRHINLSDFDPVIPLVIRECANLPLVIDIVAKTFRKKDRISLWWAGLKRLQKWPNINDQAMDEVLDRLRFCYEELGKEDKKVCFLYVALFTEGCNVYMDYLLECWRAEGFIRDADEFTARDRGQEILNDLINVSLLESSEMKHIKMNKVLRNMALKISSEKEDSKCLVKTHEEIQQPLEEEEWKQAKRISLMDNKLCSLPERPACNNLSTLLLQRNGDLTMILSNSLDLCKILSSRLAWNQDYNITIVSILLAKPQSTLFKLLQSINKAPIKNRHFAAS
ncbi:probable disease resistance protein At5g63020 [Hevea brasiliensis]|uniref:probable disease resistance protein At5g63020 n=1 Tax=Hevea brasiliensis TaxID=3981 RepID=UPI0025DF06A0|nr:probable disease resistance protein At5g63020 [Hevea brasiliensis]